METTPTPKCEIIGADGNPNPCTLTADERRLVCFTDKELAAIATLAKAEAQREKHSLIFPMFTRHADIWEAAAKDQTLFADILAYAYMFDANVGAMLADMDRYRDEIDLATEYHNRIAAYGVNYILLCEGLRRVYAVFHAYMMHEMGQDGFIEYAKSLLGGEGCDIVELDDDETTPPPPKSEAELIEERGKNLTLLRDEEHTLLELAPAERHAIVDDFMRWHLGGTPTVQGMAKMIVQSLIGRQTRCLEVSKRRAEAGAAGGRKKSAAKAEAARANIHKRWGSKNDTKQIPSKYQANSNSNSNSNSTLQENERTDGTGNAAAAADSLVDDIEAERLIDEVAAVLGDTSPNRTAWLAGLARLGKDAFWYVARQAKGKATTNAGALFTSMLTTANAEAIKAEMQKTRDAEKAAEAEKVAKAKAAQAVAFARDMNRYYYCKKGGCQNYLDTPTVNNAGHYVFCKAKYNPKSDEPNVQICPQYVPPPQSPESGCGAATSAREARGVDLPF